MSSGVRSRSLSSQDLPSDHKSTVSPRGEDLLDTVNTLLRKSQEAPRGSVLKSSGTLRLLSLILHLALVAIHLVLIGVWAKRLEYHLTFSLENQKIVSFLITVITQTFGTIYSTLLVFVTQTLSTKQDLQTHQTLTATHDNAAAWTGLGSAVLYIWNQKAVPASIMGVVSVFLYLGNIMILHITTPALFSLEAFNASRQVFVPTEGLPTINQSFGFNDITFFTTGSLYYLPYIDGSEPIGLLEGTLYDVPKPNAGVNRVQVGATGFSITCGYREDANVEYTQGQGWRLSSPTTSRNIPSTQPGIISILTYGGAGGSVLLYSTIPILDSSGSRGLDLDLVPPMQTSVSSIQIFDCYQSLVSQNATVDPQSRMAILGSVEPEIKKTSSTWLPAAPPSGTNNNNSLISSWSEWYGNMPASDLPLDSTSDPNSFISVGDMYLINKLNLHPANFSIPSSVTLHDLENALSEMVAAMFWTLGHKAPTHQTSYRGPSGDDGAPYTSSVTDAPNALFLLPGNVTVTEFSVEIRLDLSIIAIAGGLAASVALALLALPHSLSKTGEEDIPVHGTGLLHAIWLYRNHPELDAALKQVQHPTDKSLRSAGMVPTTLVCISQKEISTCKTETEQIEEESTLSSR
ncbi:hypothetical protein DFH09DRAFT_1353339 [Mycena vulgaris]|nr:hypothetical protein DFH09DRAFT_1353339 [Mycena vulgaris]